MILYYHYHCYSCLWFILLLASSIADAKLVANAEDAAGCDLPLHFTYFQKPTGYFCQVPNQYLEAQYGLSFSTDTDTHGVARETTDPNVRFTVHDVTATNDWDGLRARFSELDPDIAGNSNGVHTPSLFWDGRNDVFWHADAEEDTISTQFKAYVDAYVRDCLREVPVLNIETSTTNNSIIDIINNPATDATATESPSEIDRGDGCSLTEHFEDSAGNTTIYSNIPYNSSIDSGHCFVFFYSTGCPHCAKVKSYLEGELKEEALGIPFHFRYVALEVHKSDNAKRLIAGYNFFNWDGSQVVPTIFIGDEDDMTVLVGEDMIFDDLLPRLQELDQQSMSTECYDFEKLLEEHPELAETNLHWGMLTMAALVDSINPCAIAVLLILLGGLIQGTVPVVPPAKTTDQVHPDPALEDPATEAAAMPQEDATSNSGSDTKKDEAVLNIEDAEATNEGRTNVAEINALGGGDEEMAAPIPAAGAEEAAHPKSEAGENDKEEVDLTLRRRRRIFLSGMAFITSIYISYYALGFGIFSAVSSTSVSGAILLALGIFIILLGLWNLKDFVCYDVGYNVEIPRSWRPLLKKLLGAVASPIGAFAAGFLVCLFELPCTGGPYLFILGLLADKSTRTEAALLLLYYNFVFVLPLILINLLAYWGSGVLQRVGSWKEKYIRHLHLFAGLVLITLGVLAVVDSQKDLF